MLRYERNVAKLHKQRKESCLVGDSSTLEAVDFDSDSDNDISMLADQRDNSSESESMQTDL